MFEPDEPVGRDTKAGANLRRDFFDRVSDAAARVAERLDTRDHDATIGQVDPFDLADAVMPAR